MISFNSPNITQKPNTGILTSQHITVQAAAETAGYNIQYLRRMLRFGSLKGIKIGQMWLIEMDALTAYLKREVGFFLFSRVYSVIVSCPSHFRK